MVKNRDDESQEAWRAFVEANGLTLAQVAPPSNDIHMSGEYRGHHLMLEVRIVPVIHPRGTPGNTTTIRATLNASCISEKRLEALMRRLAGLTPLTSSRILDLLTAGFGPLPGLLEAGNVGKWLSYEESTPGRESDKLKRIADALSDLAEGCFAVVATGGEIVPALQALVKENGLLRDVIIEMLRDIAQATQRQLGSRAEQLLCPRCLARFGLHRADLPQQFDETYYGCRACHQSREFIECPKGVVAVLDAAWRDVQNQQDGCLRVNWLARRALFDFDRVEIIQATDKDIEHFAMQVGNDTDPYRKSRYGRTHCTIAPIGHPSENTLRILEATFGQVDV
jgi:hypothetical protein